MIRIALCDDDSGFLERFDAALTAVFAQAGRQVRICRFTDGKSLIEKVEKEKQFFDIIFLDVEMPEVDGFAVAGRLRELSSSFILVFTTYIEGRVREGYRYGAFRYVFKNRLEEELGEAVEGVLKRFGHVAGGREEITFKCRVAGVLEDVTVKKGDILYLRMEKTRRVTMQTLFGEYELLVKPLAEYAAMLELAAFVPILRSYLLNFDHVEGIDKDAFVLAGGLTVPLGVKREARRASMEKYLRYLDERI